MKKSLLFAILSIVGLLIAVCGVIINNFTKIYWVGFGVLLIGVVAFIVFLVKCIKKQKQESTLTSSTSTIEKRKIKSVKVLGTRAGLETRVLGTYNFTVYSMLILYTDGTKEVIECESNSAKFKELIQFIEIGNTSSSTSKPLSIDEMIEFDEMEN